MIKIFKSAEDRILEEKIYEEVAQEIAEGKFKPGLWAKALAQTDGDEQQAKAAYIKLRFQSIIDLAAVEQAKADERWRQESARKAAQQKQEEQDAQKRKYKSGEQKAEEKLKKKAREQKAEEKLKKKGYLVKRHDRGHVCYYDVHYDDGRKSWFSGTKVRDFITLLDLEKFAEEAK